MMSAMPNPASCVARLRRPVPALLSLAAAAGAAVLLGGCSSTASFERSFALDGDVGEWPNKRVAVATADYIYLRFSIAEETGARHAPDATTHLLLDIDDDAGSGLRLGDQPLFDRFQPGVPREIANLGVDIEVQLATPSEGGDPRVRLIGYERDGTPVSLHNSDIGFQIAPTYASDWYEVRIERWGGSDWPLARRGRVRGVFLTTREGDLAGASEPFSFTMPEGSTHRPASLQEPAIESDPEEVEPAPVEAAPAS